MKVNAQPNSSVDQSALLPTEQTSAENFSKTDKLEEVRFDKKIEEIENFLLRLENSSNRKDLIEKEGSKLEQFCRELYKKLKDSNLEKGISREQRLLNLYVRIRICLNQP